MPIIVGDYGQYIRINVTLNGVPADLSQATIQMDLTKPKGGTVPQKTMTGYAGGYATWQIEEGLMDEVGMWTGRLKIMLGGALYNAKVTFRVAVL